MKFFMVIIVCMTADFCEAIYDKTEYSTRAECLEKTAVVKDYMIQMFPTSRGEIHCMDEDTFQGYQDYLENNTPTVTPGSTPSPTLSL
mgnify:FL=1